MWRWFSRLYVVIMSRTRIKVNPHSIVAWMSRNSLLETGAISEFDMIRTYSQMHRTDKYSQHSSIIKKASLAKWWSVRLRTKWLWVLVPLQSCFSRFLSPPLTLCYNSSTRFPKFVRLLFPNSRSFLDCPCDLSMKYFAAGSFTVSTMGVIASLVFFIFSLREFMWIEFPDICFLHLKDDICKTDTLNRHV